MPWLNEEGKGYKEALEIYQNVSNLDLPPDWIHFTQMMRAAASVVANIAEEIGRFSGEPTPDAVRFSSFARGSLHEVGAFLDIGVIDGILTKSQAEKIKT